MSKPKDIVPDTPPSPRAPAVLDQRAAIERELSDLKLRIAETALAAYEGKPGGRDNLAALDANIRAIVFQLDCNAVAHELAVRLDSEAVATWRAEIDAADPKSMVAGITKTACCTRCSKEHGCIITSGDACAHPISVGGIGNRYQDKQPVKLRFKEAAVKLGVYR